MAKSEKAAPVGVEPTAVIGVDLAEGESQTVASAFAWSKRRADELNAAHDGQWSNFLDVFTWVFCGWAVRDAGDPEGGWILTDAGRALTETDFDAGLARALSVTFRS